MQCLALHEQARNGEQEEGQSWQRRIANLSGQLTGALSNAFSTAQSAASQVGCLFLEVFRPHRVSSMLPSTKLCHNGARTVAYGVLLQTEPRCL